MSEDILSKDPLELKGKDRDQWLASKQDQIMDEVRNYSSDPKDVEELLNFMVQFHNYSLGNLMLIKRQWDGAYAVASYKRWNDLGFPVKKGEKGKILIWVPVYVKYIILPNGDKIGYKLAPKDIKKKADLGHLEVDKKLRFRSGFVYDISQTSATIDDYPKLFPNRHFNFEDDSLNYELVLSGVDRLANEIGLEMNWDESRMIGNAKGAYFPTQHTILLNPQNTPSEVVSTSIHELAHARLHRKSNLSPHLMELQAELVATLVSNYFGLNTLEKAVGYISNHTRGKMDNEDEQLDKLLAQVQDTVKFFIKTISGELDKQE